MKIDKFNQHKNSLKEPTDEEIQDAEKILDEGVDPNWNKNKFGYFYIDVSGKYSVYYTLWRFKPANLQSYYANAEQFITNLSTDLNKAAKKAKKAAGRVPVIIDRFGTKSGMFQAVKAELMTFGKYRGKTLGDIFVEDPQYIIWLAKNYDGKSAERTEKIKYYKDLYFETITKQNKENDNSSFVGKIGEKIEIEAEVYSAEKYNNDFNDKLQTKCKLIDENSNKYLTYNINADVKKGDTVKMTAKVKKHVEKLGVKFTVIYYCKVKNVWNLEDDTKKFNI